MNEASRGTAIRTRPEARYAEIPEDERLKPTVTRPERRSERRPAETQQGTHTEHRTHGFGREPGAHAQPLRLEGGSRGGVARCDHHSAHHGGDLGAPDFATALRELRSRATANRRRKESGVPLEGFTYELDLVAWSRGES